MSVLELIRKELQGIRPYQPQEDTPACRLHANELPWSPIDHELSLNHYPCIKAQKDLQQQLACHYQVDASQLLITRGSDDGIDLLMRLFLSEGKNSVLQCPPTFPMYAFYAQLQNAWMINCPLEESNGFDLSVEKLISMWKPECKLIMLCRPNNPTGNLIDLETVGRICSRFTDKAMVIVDEAYIEFAQTPSSTTLLASFDNLVVLRTLSKACGLASLRLGCLIAQPLVIRALRSITAPFLLPGPIIRLAQSAMQHRDWFETSIGQIIRSRDAFTAELTQLACIDRVFPGWGNFVLVKSREASDLAALFAGQDIAIRSFPGDPVLHDMLRITIGSESDNARVLDVMRGE